MGPFNPVRRILKEARRQILSGGHRRGVELLEGLVGSGQDDRYILFLLAVAYIYSDEFSRAEGFMSRCSNKADDFPPYHELQAFLVLKSASDHASTIAAYSDLSKRFPGVSFIRRLLDRVLQASSFGELQRASRLADYVEIPPPPRFATAAKTKHFGLRGLDHPSRKRRKGPLIAAAAGIICIAGLLSVIFATRDRWSPYITAMDESAGAIDMITLDGSAYDLLTGTNKTGSNKFYISSRDVIVDFNSAKKMAASRKYNEALDILNRIQYANVSFAVKEKTDFLIRWIISVEERSFADVPYSAVAAYPHLYRGYSLRWRGRVANLVRRRDTVSFTLMVDYRGKDVFSGVAEVYYDEPAGSLVNGSMVGVDGILTGVLGDQKRIYLVAKSITAD